MEWFEHIADSFVWFIPIAALVGLWLARSQPSSPWRGHMEKGFFAILLLVAGGTLRTVMVNDPGWLLHTLSLGVMVIGAICPTSSSTHLESMDL
jgi:hypothetical protein